LHQLANWYRSGHLFTLKINISARDLDEPEQVDFIAHQLKHNVITAAYLTLETTESIAICGLSTSSNMHTELRKIGAGISLDDFGTVTRL
jgi:EAL domain-containing protein (putative c-di-GMP-specific phosphodiesterase class I)